MLKKRILIYMFLLATITVIVAVVFYYVRVYRAEKTDPNASDYYAFFLSNDQVYFGILDDKNRDEVVISNIYYVSAEGQNEGFPISGGSQFQLVKLGSEIHGPTDKMYITRSQILFYERLRNDSPVVRSIESN